MRRRLGTALFAFAVRVDAGGVPHPDAAYRAVMSSTSCAKTCPEVTPTEDAYCQP